MFPDFWLRDMASPTPLEVWGMSTPDYQVRKSEKAAYYDETYGKSGWWSRNAFIGDLVPNFPISILPPGYGLLNSGGPKNE